MKVVLLSLSLETRLFKAVILPASTAMSKRFNCSLCDFVVDYHYKGRQPSFAKCIMLLEDCHIMKDPFSTSGGFIAVGGNCSLCTKDVCLSSDCSLFYTQRFCLKCAHQNLDEFPKIIQKEILQRMEHKN